MTKLSFFKEAISNIKTSGSILPSSRFLTKRVLHNINFTKADIIVEFGPGNGIFTKNILKQLNSNAKLICFEINNNFYSKLKEINHPQLIVLNCSADIMTVELNKLKIKKVDYIISSLPLTNIPKKTAKIILKESYNILKKEALFIQYQYSLTYFKKLKKSFKNSVSLSFELFNIPPAVIYICKK